MTLIELCDKLGAELIIKRTHGREGRLKYSVNMHCVKIYDRPDHMCYISCERALAFSFDVNIAIENLCKKISGRYVEYGMNKLFVENLEKGDLMVSGSVQ